MAWIIDDAHTTVGFSARHMGLSTVRGQFRDFRGSIDLDPKKPSSTTGHIEIDVATIDTGNEERDGHLRSPDFFDVEKFPKLTFDIKSVSPVGDDRYRVTGDLTIKDVTREVTLDYEHAGEGTDPYGNRKLGGTLSGTISRAEWGLSWNVALETGGWLVSDKVKIEVDGQLAESQEAVDQEVEAETQPVS
jgi:polyisoprenoid-binding protein YceI